MTIADVASLITACAAGGAAMASIWSVYSTIVNGRRIHDVKTSVSDVKASVQEVHVSVNSRLTDLLEATRSSAHAAGAAEARATDKIKDALIGSTLPKS